MIVMQFRVHRKEQEQTWDDIEAPAAKRRPVTVRSVVLVSANELGPHRGTIPVKNLSEEEFATLSEGDIVSVAITAVPLNPQGEG